MVEREQHFTAFVCLLKRGQNLFWGGKIMCSGTCRDVREGNAPLNTVIQTKKETDALERELTARVLKHSFKQMSR